MVDVVRGKDVLCLQPTGYGKSLLYMLPSFAAAIAKHEDEQAMLQYGKLTVVVCPLLALLRDQQTRCEEMGLNVARWDSSTTDYCAVERLLRAGLDVLLTTPER